MRDKLKVNICYCVLYTACWGFGCWQTTYTLAGNANTTKIFEAKFEWDKDQAIMYNTIISSAGIAGLFIGSFLGGALLARGRRKTVIIAQTMSIIAALISMFPHEATLSIGRVLLGIGAGV